MTGSYYAMLVETAFRRERQRTSQARFQEIEGIVFEMRQGRSRNLLLFKRISGRKKTRSGFRKAQI